MRQHLMFQGNWTNTMWESWDQNTPTCIEFSEIVPNWMSRVRLGAIELFELLIHFPSTRDQLLNKPPLTFSLNVWHHNSRAFSSPSFSSKLVSRHIEDCMFVSSSINYFHAIGVERIDQLRGYHIHQITYLRICFEGAMLKDIVYRTKIWDIAGLNKKVACDYTIDVAMVQRTGHEFEYHLAAPCD